MSQADPQNDPQTADTSNKPIVTPSSDSAPEAAGSAPAAAAPEKKVFVGNLSSETTDADIKELFGAFEVLSLNLPVNPRTKKTVNYAIVELGTPEEASRAVSKLEGKVVKEREVNVQIARAERTRQRQRKPRTKKPAAEGDEEAAGADGDQENGAEADRKRNPRKKRANGTGDAVEDGSQETGEQGESNNRRPMRRRGPPENGLPSETTLFVANLPFDCSEEKLKEIFASYNPSSVHLALRPIPAFLIRKLAAKGEARKTRGFAFVSFETHEAQTKALALNGHMIGEREMAVKVAIEDPEELQRLAEKAAAQAEGATAAETTSTSKDQTEASGAEGSTTAAA